MFLIFSCVGFAQNNNLLPDTFGICVGDVSFLEIKKRLEKNSRIIWFDPYTGITEQQISGVQNAQFTPKHPVVKTGKYSVKIISPKGTISDSTYVILSPKPTINLRDTTLCKGRPFFLDAKNPGMKYTWNTGEATQKIKVDNGGKYWVKVNNNGCVQIDTVSVKFLAGATANFNTDMSFCLSEENKTLSVKALPNTKIIWSTGSIYPSINITKAGTYWVKTENRNCGEQVDTVHVTMKACDCEMMIPNSFTPNEDNKNDYFFPVLQCDYTSFNMTITDKWENVVFYTNSTTGKWDGRFKGNLCPEEVYYYRIESAERGAEKKVRSGKVSLFR